MQKSSDDSELTVSFSTETEGHRLDYLFSREYGLSRNYASELIKQGRAESSVGRRLKPSAKLERGENVTLSVPPPERLDLTPEDIDFGVAYDDDDLIVVDKPAGLVVHPAPGHRTGTLVHGLLARYPDIGAVNGVERPGIVHRLDAGTSGLMVVARNGMAQERLWADFKERRVGKIYLALCWGGPKKDRGTVDLPIDRDPVSRVRMTVSDLGRRAVTDYEVLRRGDEASLVKCVLHTGRTHQIRVHMREIGCPLVGDELYAPRRRQPFDPPRVFLHSWRLSFRHPRSGEAMNFLSRLPRELVDILGSM